MPKKVMKKKCKNGNLYLHFSNGKIKTINKDGTIKWRTKKFILKTQKDTKKVFF